MRKHNWKFEESSIERDQLKAITEDFKKIMPYTECEFKNSLTYNKEGIDEHRLWTAFVCDTTYNSDTFFFGVYNLTKGQEVSISNKDYDKAVVAFLAIAKVHLRHNLHVSTDGEDSDWREGISLCQSILGHSYDLLDITENGKLRFKTWELATHGA
jgi:hypothetical protein